MRLFIANLLILLSIQVGYAQAPTQLTTDLLEHTNRVFLDGYPSTLQLSELDTAVERYQTAAIRNAHPHLGWVVNSRTPNTLQQAYRIIVATSPEKIARNEADVWDSGRVASHNSVAVRYGGAALQPATTYYWKVKTWDNHGHESDFSESQCFRTAPVLDDVTARYPLQITDEYPVAVNPIDEQCTFIDFGKAAFGKLKLTLTTERAHDTVTIRLGEQGKNGRVDRNPGGTIRYTEYRLALLPGTHTYALKFRPDPRNTQRKTNESGVDPIFMPHYIGEVYPFRYCEVDGYTGMLTDKSIVRPSVHYPFNDHAAHFHSSDTVLNRVWELCKYSIKATSFLGVYVDGDRERIPYEADAFVNQLCHYAVDREYAMPRYSHEHLILNPTWPTEWILLTVFNAWNDYLYTGNKASLERYYADLEAKTLSALKESNSLISTRTGKQTDELNRSIHFKGKALRDIVDWPQSGIVGDEKPEAGEADGYVLTTYNTVVNAYHYETLRLMSLIAAALGNEADRQRYSREAEKVKAQFNRLLLDPRKGYYNDGIETTHSSLHANMLPMALGMVPAKYAKSVTEFIQSRGMACSVYGSQFLLDAVYNAHEAAYGLQLLASTRERSWYNMLRAGSTITMEAWDNKYKPNQDWNHAWGAAPANLIPRKLFGIEPLEPGFARFRIQPQPASLREASIRMPSIRGDIGVAFTNRPQESFAMEVEVPGNAVAEVYLPLIGKSTRVEVDGVIKKGIASGTFVKVEVGSGKHSLKVRK